MGSRCRPVDFSPKPGEVCKDFNCLSQVTPHLVHLEAFGGRYVSSDLSVSGREVIFPSRVNRFGTSGCFVRL